LTYLFISYIVRACRSDYRNNGRIEIAPEKDRSSEGVFRGVMPRFNPADQTAITDPVLASTEISGQFVDENGDPLAGMPVSIGGATAVTNASGYFTLTGVAANQVCERLCSHRARCSRMAKPDHLNSRRLGAIWPNAIDRANEM
jgi:hypothetical protein